MSICAAHRSWVCCSKSTNRMTSYSSSVSRIGSVFSHPLGQNASTCGTPQIRRHRGGLGMGAFLPLYSVYTDYSTLSRKKQFFSKAAAFSFLICVLADIRCQRLRVRHCLPQFILPPSSLRHLLVSNNQSAILLEWCKKAVENKLHRPKCLDLEF